jgi:hypothetical protein
MLFLSLGKGKGRVKRKNKLTGWWEITCYFPSLVLKTIKWFGWKPVMGADFLHKLTLDEMNSADTDKEEQTEAPIVICSAGQGLCESDLCSPHGLWLYELIPRGWVPSGPG